MTGAGETLASAVVARVCLKLGNLLAQQLDLVWNLKDHMESMQSMMLVIQAVLSDAEKRSLRKEAESERLWLRKLKSAAYEIEDLLSDFDATTLPKMSTGREEKIEQVKLFFSSSNPIISHVTLAYNMMDLKKRLDKIVSERRDFDFKADNSSDLSEDLEIKNRETFSEIGLTHRSKIIGRDEEKGRIVDFLLQTNAGESISTISIVGFGGLGKTTLAQLAFNDESVKTNFDIRAWVYVSMDFDLFKIGKTILSQVANGGQTHDSLQSVSKYLKSVLANKQFLIVLDDLWEEDGKKLERLNSMLTGGLHGSKLIVTTRSKNVAQLMASTNDLVHSLAGLSDEDCWSIFSQRAFVAGDKVDSSLIEIGRDITKKCKGVPLSAIALGYILRSQKDDTVWSAVRDSEFWEFEDGGVLSSLKQSYYQLPPPLKLCFSYCAIFPKGSDISKDKLIQQWIALEFIQNLNKKFTPEMIGEEYVSILLGMSFLQHSPNYAESQNLLCMHDLVHDLARSVVGDEMVVLDARREITENRNPANCYSYYSLLANYDSMEAYLDGKVLPNKTRALHFTNCNPMLFTDKVFSQRSLRVLSLRGCHVENLPEPVYRLKQLRYLEVSVVKAKFLHKSFCNLLNLEALDLSKSSLEELPTLINKLENLKTIILRGCSLLRVLPESFSKLCLLTHVDLSDCCSLQNLPESIGNIPKLCFLQLSGCSELQELPKSITNLEHLTHLDISGCSSLKMLPELFQNLSSLRLLYLSGCSKLKRFPESFGNMRKLKTLELSGCSELQKLPESFSNLENLEHLDLSLCHKFYWLPECFGNLNNLKSLNLSSCSALRKLPESFDSLRNVEKIDLSWCCNLEEFPISFTNSDKLPMLDLRGCSKLKSTAVNFASLQERYDFQQLSEIYECKEIGHAGKKCSNIVRLQHLNQIQGKLCIRSIENVHSSEEAERAKLCNKSKLHSLTLQWSTPELSEEAKKDELVVEKFQPHRNLELLTLDGYRGTRFPSWVMELESSLPNLTQITLCNLPHCEQLLPFEHLSNLEIIEIHNAPKIKRIRTDMRLSRGLYKKLKVLSIREMPDLEEWSIISSTNDTKLERLEIYKCPRAIFRPCLPSTETSIIIESSMSLSLGSVASLNTKSRISKMYIENCSITSDEWGGLGCLMINHLELKSCKDLYFLPKGIAGLASLQSLTINSCNSELHTFDGYDGTRFPSLAVGLESSLPNVTRITLCSLPHCKQLPPFEHLKNLEILEIHCTSEIKRIKTDIQPSRGSFKKLKILSIREMPDLEEWSITGLDYDTKLERLEIYKCPHLIFRPSLPSTETSFIIESSMSLSSGSVASLFSKLRISKMYIESCSITSDEWGGLGSHIIKNIEIKSCRELYLLPKGILALTSLKSLTINDCNCLCVLPEWLGEISSLRSLSICWCRNLKSFPLSIQCLTALEHLHVRNCSHELEDHSQRVNKNRISHVGPIISGVAYFGGWEKIDDLEDNDILCSASVEVLGSGSFGSTHKATLVNGRVVVVKRLKGVNISERDFRDKIRALGAMNHPNLMPLGAYNYSTDKDLLYDFMPMGCLSLWLHGKVPGPSSIYWYTRSKIALAVAHGLKYIHEISPQCAHGNIKASNILLSGSNGFPEGAKLANHGLAHLIGGPAACGYKAPEMADFDEATQKSDVYSFGVLLMELLTGRDPECPGKAGIWLPDWVQRNFQGQWGKWRDVWLLGEKPIARREMIQMMQLAVDCTSLLPERRPTMKSVVCRIEDISNLTNNR